MSVVQFYKSQLKIGSNLYPVPPGGAQLNWPKNHVAPSVAGNYWQINYIEGLQLPTVNATIALIDGDVNKNPLHAANLNAQYMTRSADYAHDVANMGGLYFFDGFSGFSYGYAKANTLSISGSKGDDLRFNTSYMLYQPVGVTLPAVTTTPADALYSHFVGQPMRFQALSFKKNGSFFDGILSFNVALSNNMSPDLSMQGQGPQTPLPVDCNAGQPTATAQFTFQANQTNHIVSGDTMDIIVSQGSVACTIRLNEIVVETPYDRAIGTGRQTRAYNCLLMGESNTVPPITIL